MTTTTPPPLSKENGSLGSMDEDLGKSIGGNSNDRKSDEESVKSGPKRQDNTLDRSLRGLAHLKHTFRPFSTPRRSSEKDKNEPTRFLGDGMTFKAKLIGILKVDEARGDRMCQEALNELKMAVKAAGEHKQRINIVVCIEGLRLKDEKTGDCLYHHPVHKISFIAQDVTDSRAFGYIFGSPDTGHKFFGIKTDKAASQVVIAMRDLFHVVYELKKGEVEAAKQNIEQHQMKYGSSFVSDNLSISSSKSGSESLSKFKYNKEETKSGKNRTQTAGVISDLMDLELELTNLQQGLSQMERLTPSDPFSTHSVTSKEDPFGDSFTPPLTSPPPLTKLPPPPSSGDRRKPATSSLSSITPPQPELHWFDRETERLFQNDILPSATAATTTDSDKQKVEIVAANEEQQKPSKDLFDIFTDLDPLGTGKIKPYVDKKDFFQELKNPRKKSLSDVPSDENETSPLTGEGQKPSDDEPKKVAVDTEQQSEFADFSSLDNAVFEKRRDTSSVISDTSAQVPAQDLIPSGEKPKLAAKINPADQPRRRYKYQKSSSQKIVIDLKRILANADDTDKENDSQGVDGIVLQSPESPVRVLTSSDSLESIPEPPPRPITSPPAIQPPPLPPKKANVPVTMKSPRPPSAEAGYDYIENYGSPRAGDQDSDEPKIPPIPAPSRKSRFGYDSESDIVRQRPKQTSEYYLTPVTGVPGREPEASSTITPSLEITLKQLTSTDFEELSSTLGIPAPKLKKMTLGELTDYLSKHLHSSNKSDKKNIKTTKSSKLTVKPSELKKSPSDSFKTSAKPKESFSESFKADFDSGFEGVSKEIPVDRYAVFRELIEEEKAKAAETLPIVTRDSPEIVAPETAPSEDVSEKESSPKIEPTEDAKSEISDSSVVKEPETFSAEVTDAENKSVAVETRPGSNGTEHSVKNWTTFETVFDQRVTPQYGQKGESLWTAGSTEKELGSSGSDSKKESPKRESSHHKHWAKPPPDYEDFNDYEEDSEENWESSKRSQGSSWDESSWKENGWSDRDSYEESASTGYKDPRYSKKKGYQRKFPPRTSPWDEDGGKNLVPRRPKQRSHASGRYDDPRAARSPYSPIEPEQEDGLQMLRLVLGQKRLKELEDQFLKEYLRKDLTQSRYNYLKDPALQKQKQKHPRKYYTPRPRSAEKLKKYAQPESGEVFVSGKYRRPYSHDELTGSDEDRYPQKYTTKPWGRDQVSPFENTFSMTYSSRMKSGSRHLRPPSEKLYYSTHEMKPCSRDSSQRQSPFEDDFTPPDIQRRGSDHSASSDVSKSGDAHRTIDPYYSSESLRRTLEPGLTRDIDSGISRLARHDPRRRDLTKERLDKHYENIEIRRKPPETLYYDKPSPKETKYKYTVEGPQSPEKIPDLKSPKKVKAQDMPHRKLSPYEPAQQYASYKAISKTQKPRGKVRHPSSFNSGSDSPEAPDFGEFSFPDRCHK